MKQHYYNIVRIKKNGTKVKYNYIIERRRDKLIELLRGVKSTARVYCIKTPKTCPDSSHIGTKGSIKGKLNSIRRVGPL